MRTTFSTEQTQPSARWAQLAQLAITLVYPLLLVLIAVRLVMTPLFLHLEYHRADFPPDPYGFTLADRLNYAPYAIEFLLNGAGIEYLGDLRFEDGTPMYNVRELRHMYDVKVVTQAAFALAWVGAGVLAAAGFALLRRHETQRMFFRGLWNGAALTLALIALIVVGAVLSWRAFFVLFHEVFFEADTWYFPTSDTLIRLFPEQFWFDAALTTGGIAIVIALITLIALRKRR